MSTGLFAFSRHGNSLPKSLLRHADGIDHGFEFAPVQGKKPRLVRELLAIVSGAFPRLHAPSATAAMAISEPRL